MAARILNLTSNWTWNRFTQLFDVFSAAKKWDYDRFLAVWVWRACPTGIVKRVGLRKLPLKSEYALLDIPLPIYA